MWLFDNFEASMTKIKLTILLHFCQSDRIQAVNFVNFQEYADFVKWRFWRPSRPQIAKIRVDFKGATPHFVRIPPLLFDFGTGKPFK